jgi:hypothetical protein
LRIPVARYARGHPVEKMGVRSPCGNGGALRNHLVERIVGMAMSRSSSWKEHRLANRLRCGEGEYSVDLVARKATGVEGWKMTLVFLPRDSGAEVKLELPNAPSTADVRRQVRDLEGADDRLQALFAEAASPEA